MLLLLAACAPAGPVAFAPATQAPPAPEPTLVATETLAPSPTPTETPAPTATATETLAPTATPSPAPTNTPTPEPTPTPRPEIVAREAYTPRRGPGEEYPPMDQQYWFVYQLDIKAVPGGRINARDILEKYPDAQGRGYWLKVMFEEARDAGGTVLWVPSWVFDTSAIDLDKIRLAREIPPTPEATATPEFPTAVARQNLNLRGGPGTEYAVVGGLKAGDRVRITGRTGDGQWLQVEHNGKTVWVSAGLVTASGLNRVEVVAAPPPPTKAPEPPAPKEAVGERRYLIPAQPNSGFPTPIDLRDQSISRIYNGQWGNVFSISSRYDSSEPGFFHIAYQLTWEMCEVIGVDGSKITVRYLTDNSQATIVVQGNSHINVMRPSITGNMAVQFGNIDVSDIPRDNVYAADIIWPGDHVGIPKEDRGVASITAILLSR